MRRSRDLPADRSSSRRLRMRVLAAVVVAGLLVLGLSLRGMAGFYTDFLWFDSLDRTDVWRQVFGAKVALTLICFAVFLGIAWLNLWIADRCAPPSRPPGPEEELLGAYNRITEGRTGLIRVLISGIFAVFTASGVSNNWEEWLLFVNRRDFGIKDPQFNTDIGFYVFELPFLSFVVGWAFAAFIVIFVLVAITHYLNGGIRFAVPAGSERVTPSVKVHLSAILAILAIIRAADYWLSRFEFTVSRRGVVDGALYTDVNAQLPVTHLLIAISLSAVVLLIINLRLRGWVMPILAVGLWSFTAIAMGGLYPAFVQRFQVEPNETAREAPYTLRNINATRDAYGLVPGADLTEISFDYTKELTAQDVRQHADTIRNARVLDPVVTHPTFERFQAQREFYRFDGSPVKLTSKEISLDTDRYVVDGQITQVVLGVRELSLGDLAWEREHVRLTHGYGIALARANATTGEGRPAFLAGGLPVEVDPSIELGLTRPQIYYGEGLSGYALVGTSVDEIDYVDSGTNEDVLTRYEGDSGVAMGSLLRRAAFAMRFGQIEPLISNFVGGDTRVIYIRGVHDRVRKLAPFLRFDSDAYPVVVDGTVHYVIDAYTTSQRYPYSQHAENSRLVDESGLSGDPFNYVRNSVKAVVNAYSGDVKFYVMPVDDPIVDAWRDAFPGLFSDFEEMPEALRDNLRYPQDLFRVQTNMWARYQVSNPESLVIGTERWAVAQDPGRRVVTGSTESFLDEETGLAIDREQRIDPYYTLLKLPGEDEASYVTLRSYVPFDENDDRRELVAFTVGETRTDGTSRLVTYEITSPDAPGPVLVASSIAQEEAISSRLTLLDDSGSTVEFGNLLLLPIADSILWVRPLYVAAEGTSSVPTLEAVIATVGEGEKIAIGEDLNEALAQLFPGENFDDILGSAYAVDRSSPTEGKGGSDPADRDPSDPGGPPAGAEQVLVDIAALFAARDAALAESPPDRVAAAEILDQISVLLSRAGSS